MLWWVWDAPNWPGVVTGPYQGAYTAMGANGQYIAVLPAMNLVLAHKVDFDEDGRRQISLGQATPSSRWPSRATAPSPASSCRAVFWGIGFWTILETAKPPYRKIAVGIHRQLLGS
jgi:hypothetical protein